MCTDPWSRKEKKKKFAYATLPEKCRPCANNLTGIGEIQSWSCVRLFGLNLHINWGPWSYVYFIVLVTKCTKAFSETESFNFKWKWNLKKNKFRSQFPNAQFDLVKTQGCQDLQCSLNTQEKVCSCNLLTCTPLKLAMIFCVYCSKHLSGQLCFATEWLEVTQSHSLLLHSVTSSVIGKQTLWQKGQSLKGGIVDSLSHQFVEPEREQLSYKIKPWCRVGLLTVWQNSRENSCLVSKQTSWRMLSSMLKGSKCEMAKDAHSSHLTWKEVWNQRQLKGFVNVSVLGECKGPHCKTKVCCERNNVKQMWAIRIVLFE